MSSFAAFTGNHVIGFGDGFEEFVFKCTPDKNSFEICNKRKLLLICPQFAEVSIEDGSLVLRRTEGHSRSRGDESACSKFVYIDM